MTANEILNLIANNSRDNIYCVYPVTTDETIGKLISALSNSSGGLVAFGVQDDGKKLRVKGYKFNINFDSIKAKLSDNVNLTFFDLPHETETLKCINVKQCENMVVYSNVPYTLDGNRNVTELYIKKVFLSYSHNDTCIADLVDEKLYFFGKGRLAITRDKRTLEYKSDIEKFMQTVSSHDFMVSIISDSYLKSQGCMYEVSELMRNRAFNDKLLTIILSEADENFYSKDKKPKQVKADVYSLNRFEYLKYWETEKGKVNKLNSEISDLALKQGLVDEIKRINTISTNVSELIEIFKKSLGKDFTEINQNEFSDLLSILLS
ncbi:TIR domain-containing protein [Natranaerovirga pectinivora]|uniref:TIR domain-containing protein n=1 Tax=Natranaerovirga pectinivora TaxID=682400 RepID=A0A4R3MQR3_9FIRM|nr:TIR domain-containing protein [Natranaerovirga pectinivora]TCT17124.1 TIR domain-containing protein [Natranaerovirga pectinivora]